MLSKSLLLAWIDLSLLVAVFLIDVKSLNFKSQRIRLRMMAHEIDLILRIKSFLLILL